MLIALVGLAGAGKSTVAAYLQREQGFTRVVIGLGGDGDTDAVHCRTKAEMLHFVTANWHRNYVTLDLQNSRDAAPFEKRPFFLLVSIEAPLLSRWRRCQAK